MLVVAALFLVPAGTAVVGGSDAPNGAYPSNVFVRFGLLVSFECTGTLIAPDWVLTAGHCGSVTGIAGDSPVEWPPALIDLYIGGDTRATGDHPTVAAAYGHPSQSLGIDYDVSLLHLSRVSTKTPTKVIGVTETSAWSPGTTEWIVGWGVDENGFSPNHLQQAQVPITTDAYCSGAYGSSFDPVTMVCAGFPQGGVDTCQGDSGGPMFGTVAGQLKVVGTTSWGEGCAEAGRPGVYARVGDHSINDWIKSMVPNGVD